MVHITRKRLLCPRVGEGWAEGGAERGKAWVRGGTEGVTARKVKVETELSAYMLEDWVLLSPTFPTKADPTITF